MEPFEIELTNALKRTDPIPATEVAALNRRIVEAYARKQKGVFQLLVVYLALLLAAIVAMLALFMSISDLKHCLLLGIGILAGLEGTVLMKLWYWIMHSKIATMREIKLLQLAIAELKPPRSPAPARPASSSDESRPLTPSLSPGGGEGARRAGEGDAREFMVSRQIREEHRILPENIAPESAPPLPRSATPKFWWTVLFALWLLALAGLGYSVWVLNPYAPRNVTPYFERVVTTGNGFPETEWQQTFEVTQARGHFHPQVVAAKKTAQLWISMSAEGRKPMYSGPVGARSVICFGRATPGRYVVKGRTEKADGAVTLRIGGVDEVPGAPSFGRLLLLMLSSLLAVAIPVIWLQSRWMRRIDPELE